LTPVLWVAAVIAIAATLVGLDRVVDYVASPRPRPLERTVPELGVAHEDFTIPSGDHELAAWLLTPDREGPVGPLVLLAHGWGANYSVVLRLAEPLATHGHDVLLFDVRGHGRNEPLPYVTVKHFREDITAAARYAAHRFPGRPLVLVGHSFGGAAGILAVADGAPVAGLVLIAAPSDVLRVTAEFLSDQGLPGRLIVNLLRPFFWRRVGSTFRPLTPSRRIGEVDVPILMIQPQNDERVIRSHADRLARAGRVEYHLIAGREHTDVLSAPETLRLIEDFLERL